MSLSAFVVVYLLFFQKDIVSKKGSQLKELNFLIFMSEQMKQSTESSARDKGKL